MIQILENELEGKWAYPKFDPIPCPNPNIWQIIQVKIKYEWNANTKDCIWKIWIRGEHSIWFRVDQCWIYDKETLLNEIT